MHPYKKDSLVQIIEDAILIGFILLAIFIALGVSGCAALTTDPNAPPQGGVTASPAAGADPSAVYKYDLTGMINGVSFSGVAVIPYASSYDMTIVSKVNVDMLTIKSCHREFSVESAIQLGWFDQGRGYGPYHYQPAPGIEDVGSCLVRFGAYNKSSSQQNAWGIIDFENPDRTLPALNLCNGDQINSNGVSICQARVGLVERLIFPVPVRSAVNSVEQKCRFDAPSDQKTFEIVTPKGECVVEFEEISSPHRLHRHTTVGYDEIMIRGK